MCFSFQIKCEFLIESFNFTSTHDHHRLDGEKCVIIIHIFWLVPFLFCYTQPIYYWWNKNEGRNRHKKNKYERRRNERLRKKPKEESNIKSIRQPPCNFLMLFDLLQLTAIITFWRPFLWSFLSLLFLLYDSINFFQFSVAAM